MFLSICLPRRSGLPPRAGIEVVNLDSEECRADARVHRRHPEIWNEDIGEE
jgi:hypothetical protein